jgi:hypothetical protein
MRNRPVFLGDGVFVEFVKDGVRLTASNGPEMIHTICLRPAVLMALFRFCRRAL